MAWIATAEECRELDRRAQEEGTPVEALMHEAGRAVAAAVLENFPKAKRIAVVCGKGNNGGDGLVAAKLLAERQLDVSVLVAAPSSELNEQASREVGRLSEPGVEPIYANTGGWSRALQGLRKQDLIIDALLGTGAKGEPLGAVREVIAAIVASEVPVLSVDIPSGVECDSGKALGQAVRAARTVTFGLAKPFLFQSDGLELSGEWSVAPIGFSEKLLEQPRRARLVEKVDVSPLLPTRTRAAHKHSVGSLVIVAGSRDMPGAAVLCARAALRGGAGLVTVASTAEVCRAVSHSLPEAIVQTLPDENGALGASAAEAILQDAFRFDAAVVGPGLSQSPEVESLLQKIWHERTGWKWCIDADALTWVSKGILLPDEEAVLTPHSGEMGRLLGCEASDIEADRFGRIRQGRDRFGKSMLLKGAYTLTLGQQSDVIQVNPTGNPGLATGGTGDVLSGVIGALLLQRTCAEAAMAATYWHGLAADLCAKRIAEVGYLASEVADALPQARATM